MIIYVTDEIKYLTRVNLFENNLVGLQNNTQCVWLYYGQLGLLYELMHQPPRVY